MVDSVFAPMSSMIVIHWAAAGRVGSVVVGKEESNCDSWGSALGGAEGTSPAMLRPVAPLHFFDVVALASLNQHSWMLLKCS